MSDEQPPVDTDRYTALASMAGRDGAEVFAGEGFDKDAGAVWNQARIMVVGAGGLGCEILHCLATMGFEDIHVVDMDTIDLTNLNRQFLFRNDDIDKSKSEVAAAFINNRFPHVKVTAHHCPIQDKNDEFFKSFHVVILGLDSILARRWINEKYATLAKYQVVDDPTAASGKRAELVEAMPVIDGGTEGFRGSARHISYGESACIECSMYLSPPQQIVPVCTLASTPRNPAHCVLWVQMAMRGEGSWEEEKPFGKDTKIEGDDPKHIVWIMEQAEKRRQHYKIDGVIDFQFTQGVIKNVVPAVGFTNAMVAAMCCNETFKLISGVSPPMNNYTYYDGSANGITSYNQRMDADPDCPVCQVRKVVVADKSWTPRDMMDKGIVPLGLSVIMKVKEFNKDLEKLADVEKTLAPLEKGHEPSMVCEALPDDDALEAAGAEGTSRVTVMLPSEKRTSAPHPSAAGINATYGEKSVYEALKEDSARGAEFDSCEMELTGDSLKEKVLKLLGFFK